MTAHALCLNHLAGFGGGFTVGKTWFLLEDDLLLMVGFPHLFARLEGGNTKEQVVGQSGSSASDLGPQSARMFQLERNWGKGTFTRTITRVLQEKSASRITFLKKNSKSVESGLELQGTNRFQSSSNISWTHPRTWGSSATIDEQMPKLDGGVVSTVRLRKDPHDAGLTVRLVHHSKKLQWWMIPVSPTSIDPANKVVRRLLSSKMNLGSMVVGIATFLNILDCQPDFI